MSITKPALTEEKLKALLVSVGADPGLDLIADGQSLSALGLDSLAVIEVATKLEDAHGLAVDEDALPDLRPSDILALAG